jgi:hypothetical protein
MEIYASRVISIYNTYNNIIAPMTVEIELLDGEYPIEIMNEIRAVFTHLSRYYMNEDIEIKVVNVEKAESHIKRAMFDCFKYFCFSIVDYVKKFDKRYLKVDYSLIDNGLFLEKLTTYESEARRLLNKARKKEIENPYSEELFTDYEEAHTAFSRLYSLLDNTQIHAEKLKRKAIFKDYLAWASFAVGIIGVILTIISSV